MDDVFIFICPYCDEEFNDFDEHFEHVTCCDENDEDWSGV